MHTHIYIYIYMHAPIHVHTVSTWTPGTAVGWWYQGRTMSAMFRFAPCQWFMAGFTRLSTFRNHPPHRSHLVSLTISKGFPFSPCFRLFWNLSKSRLRHLFGRGARCMTPKVGACGRRSRWPCGWRPWNRCFVAALSRETGCLSGRKAPYVTPWSRVISVGAKNVQNANIIWRQQLGKPEKTRKTLPSDTLTGVQLPCGNPPWPGKSATSTWKPSTKDWFLWIFEVCQIAAVVRAPFAE